MADPAEMARQAFGRADRLEAELLHRWPDAWQQLDDMRTNPPMTWPQWCLLPMGAAAAVATAPGRPYPQGNHIAALSALYAWRYCRSVYVLAPELLHRLFTQIPDSIGLDDLVTLPEWTVYIAGGEWDPFRSMWGHLEYDVNTGRPELRLLIDTGDNDGILPVPVYLDRPSLTEALADWRATVAASLTGSGEIIPGHNVRGGEPDASVAGYAELVEQYVAVVAYLARPQADIVAHLQPGHRPVRRTTRPNKRTVWKVGYSTGL